MGAWRIAGSMAELSEVLGLFVSTFDNYYVMVPNKPGEGVRLFDTLRQEGINLLACSGFPEGR